VFPSKACRDCGIVKSLEDFYSHPYMADGRLNSCKGCRREYQKQRQFNGLTQFIDYNRLKNNPKRREQMRAHRRDWRKRNPEKRRVHVRLARAIKAQKIARQPCVVCGKEDQIRAHHPDYNKPLNGLWLCAKHHTRIHL